MTPRSLTTFEKVSVLLAKALLCCGFFIFGLVTIDEIKNIAESILDLDQTKIYSSPQKKLVVIFDKDAPKLLKSYGVTVEEFVREANSIFSIADLPIGYDLLSVKRKYVKLSSRLAQIDFSESDDWEKGFEDDVRKYGFANMELNTVTLILTDKMKLGEGFVYKWSLDGNGTIVMGAGFDSIIKSKIGVEECGFMGCYRRSAKLTYLRFLSAVLAHEQAHLYGIRHVNYIDSIMYNYSNNAAEQYVVFDDSSVTDLHRAVKKFVF